jgi:hypothetical protein
MKVYLTDLSDKDILHLLLKLDDRVVSRSLIDQRINELKALEGADNESKSARMSKVKRKHNSVVGLKGRRAKRPSKDVSGREAADNTCSPVSPGNQPGGTSVDTPGINGCVSDQPCGEQSELVGGVHAGSGVRDGSGSDIDSDSTVRSSPGSGEGRQDEACAVDGVGQDEKEVA